MNPQTLFHFRQILINLDQCLDKAAAYADLKKIDLDVLAHYRLAPDMFNLIRQIQSTCDVAKFAAAYLSGQTAPKHEDNEKTWAELHARLKKVIVYLETFKESDFSQAEKAQVKPGWAKGQWLSGGDYFNQVAVPNFYFHAAMTYAILRHAGVDLGKMDFLGPVNLQG